MTNKERQAKKLLGIERRKHILELLDNYGGELTGLELVRLSQRSDLPVDSKVFLRRSVVYHLLARMEKAGDVEGYRVDGVRRFRRKKP